MVTCADTHVIMQFYYNQLNQTGSVYDMRLNPSKSHLYGRCVLKGFWLKLKYQNSPSWDANKGNRNKDEISTYLKT